jgi:GNAT superfamily N-acetyltransferase
MRLSTRNLAGFEYLRAVTELLQRIRLASPLGGSWEAADLQWAWRKDQHTDPAAATFWFDETGEAVAGVAITDWGSRLGCELLVHPDVADMMPAVWSAALESLAQLPDQPVEVSVRDDDLAMIELITAAGFSASDEVFVSCWLDAAARPAISELATGYRLLSRADVHGTPHHMIKRSGAHVAERLMECSLYDPTMDLLVIAPDGSVAAYGLFWPDPVTGVGLVEPMRTEEEHQGMGLARHVLTAGIERLVAAGCTRLKITYMQDNPISGHIYRSAGFVPTMTDHAYGRSIV